MKQLTKRILLLLIGGVLCANTTDWAFNDFLYGNFTKGQQTGDFSAYNEWKAAGAPCFGWIGQGDPDESTRPVCFYDPGVAK